MITKLIPELTASRLIAAIILSGVALASRPVAAQLTANVWNGGSGSYADTTKWSKGSLPMAGVDLEATVRSGVVNVGAGLPTGLATLRLNKDAADPQPVTINVNAGANFDMGTSTVRGDIQPSLAASGSTMNFFADSYTHAWFLSWGNTTDEHYMNVYGNAHIFINDGGNRGGFIFPKHLYVEGPNAILDAGRSGAGYVQFNNSGEYTMGITGPDHSKFVTTGYGLIRGTLNIKFLNGYVPALGETWDILEAGEGMQATNGGKFPTVNVLTTAGLPATGAFYQTIIPGTSVSGPKPQILRLSFLDTTTLADFNNDGHINLFDWQIMKSHMFMTSSTGDTTEGDITLDGKVDYADFRVWKGVYLSQGGSLAALTGIPEPNSALLAIAAGAIAMAARRRRRMPAALALMVLPIGASSVCANTTWVGPTPGDYNNPANWASNDVPPLPGVPDTFYDTVATISYGTINVNPGVLPTAPKIQFVNGPSPITFNVNSGANLTLNGQFQIYNSNVNGNRLNIFNGGVLNMQSADLDDNATTRYTLYMEGNAVFNVTGPTATTYLPGDLRIVGPNVTIHGGLSTGSLQFEADGTYTATITGPTHSTLVTGGTANVNGNLKLLFGNGYVPALGTTWDLVSANSMGSSGTNKFISIDASAAGTLPAGAGFYQSIVPRDGGGQILKLALIRQLKLVVNRVTGNVSISNIGNGATDFNGYSLSDVKGSITPGSLTTLTSQGIGTFTVTGTPSATQVVETAASGYSVGATTSLSLGNIYHPTPTKISENVEQTTFRYTTPSGLTVDAQVEFVGYGKNNIVLTVDPATGMARLQNESQFTVDVDAYSITSAGGSLAGGTWNSFQDQGKPGWEETVVTSNRLAEFSVTDKITFAPGATFSLGKLFNTSSGMPLDLNFEFLISGSLTANSGAVAYGALSTTLPGDYDVNGRVDGGDLLMIQRNPSLSLQTWKDNFGRTSAVAAAAAVPEPAEIMLVMSAAIGLAVVRRRAAR
jgi:hypothetical protein